MREDETQNLSSQGLQILPRLSPYTRSIIADNNQIASLPSIPQYLEHLSLIKNKIAFLGTLSLEGKSLQYLDLSFNRLISLEGINLCKSLKVLKLSNNYIGDDQSLYLQDLTELRVLDISHNHLRDKKLISVINSLKNLEELFNTSNDFSEWKMEAGMKSLKILVLDSNKIRKIEFCADLPKLVYLSARENNVLAVNGISRCLSIEQLDLSANDLSQISDEFSLLDKLKILNLRNNSLNTLPKLRQVEIIDISHNTLLSIMSLGTSVAELYASHNSISQIPNLPNLTIADLSYNKLTVTDGLDQNERLLSLNLAHNLLNGLQPIMKSLKRNKNLKNLNVEGIDLNNQDFELIFDTFPQLQYVNGQNLQKFIEIRKNRLNSYGAWDNLSKSKLFPSCRSSLGELDKNLAKNASNEISIFSDYKSASSLMSSINSNIKPEGKNFGQDTEYELLAKELDINNRIRYLDQKTKHLGDSLISKASNSASNLEKWKNTKDLNDSLISVKSKKDSNEIPRRSHTIHPEPQEPCDKSIEKALKGKSRTNDSINISRVNTTHSSNSLTPCKSTSSQSLIPQITSKPQLIENSMQASIPVLNTSSSQVQNYKEAKTSTPIRQGGKASSPQFQDNKTLTPLKSNQAASSEFRILKLAHKDRPEIPHKQEKDDSTISFNISNDVSKSKEQVLYVSDRSKRSRCCKHCCKKKKKSAVVQTTLKEAGGRFIDQATSPMNSLIKLSPIKSSRPSSEYNDDPVKLVSDKSITPVSNRSFMTDIPYSSNRNKSFIDDKETRYSSQKRSSTPLLSQRSLPPKAKEPERGQLINYACTPPRPILSSEGNSSILCCLNPKSSEFYLVSQLFTSESEHVKEVIKTFTFSLQKSLKSKFESNINRSQEKMVFVFYQDEPANLEIICNSPDGFHTLIDPSKKDLIVFTDLSMLKNSFGCRSLLVSIVVPSTLTQCKLGMFKLNNSSRIAPVYLVEFVIN